MKQKLYAALCIFSAASMTTACGSSFKASESTVYITNKGTVIGADIEDFSEDYYDEEELKNYITDSVGRYAAENGDGSIELDDFQIVSSSDGKSTAHLYLNYATYIDFAQFEDVLLYTGTTAQAQADGYKFNQKFQQAEDGVITGGADAQEFLDSEEFHAVIIKKNTLVKIDGTIAYISEGNVELTAKDTARVTHDTEDPDAEPAYIIYK